MQQSSHIGKIVVRPPISEFVRPTPHAVRRSASTAPISITGAFGGFGLETAKWLVENGARHLVLIGRKVPRAARPRRLLNEFTERGVDVVADACDVTDVARA